MKGSRVLVVDDNPAIRLMTTLWLDDLGVETAEVSTGAGALALLRTSEFDLVLLDHRMPQMTGLEVAQALREQGNDVPIVLCSAFLDPEAEAVASAMGLRVLGRADEASVVGAVREALMRTA